MIGAIAQVSDPAHETISLQHDPELEDARWFEVEAYSSLDQLIGNGRRRGQSQAALVFRTSLRTQVTGTLSRVVIHSSQPWPYPANLMIGAIAQVSDPAHETPQNSSHWYQCAAPPPPPPPQTTVHPPTRGHVAK
jgi:NADH pyrophosphatase NudC (nudix superfamily)